MMSVRAFVSFALILTAEQIAFAQLGAIVAGARECVLLQAECDPAMAESCEGAFECRTVPLGAEDVAVCAPIESAFCCAGEEIVCPDDTTCHFGVLGEAVGLCLRDTNDYCSDEPTFDQVRACHTGLEGEVPVAYASGDCDGDGVRNSDELAAGSEVCTPPPAPIGAFVPDGSGGLACVAGVVTCPVLGEACTSGELTGACQLDERTGTSAPLCAPVPNVFCCDANVVCPALSCVTATDRDDGLGVCADPADLCDDHTEAGILQCFTTPDGTRGLIGGGDCDADGMSNDEERRAGRDPCGPDADAGAVEPMDAGSAGEEIVEPNFRGGGGCACRATPRSRSELAGGAILLAVWLLRSRARRRTERLRSRR